MRRALLLAVAGLAASAAPAAAHVTVEPTVVAPGDPVLFELLVPNERSQRTVEVALQIPKGVLPFSFDATPGWTRRTEPAADGSVGVVRWRGRLAADGFVRFSFLASTPEKEGALAWKAVQTYDDGKASRWIGAPDAEQPAAVTRVLASASRRNAGGEGAAAAAPTSAAATSSVSATQTTTDRDALTLALAGGGLLLGVAALAVALVSRRRSAG